MKRYLNEKLKHVGKLKAGWVAAARALGYRPPGWVTRHSREANMGYIIDRAASPLSKYIELANLVPYGGDVEETAHIIEQCLKWRTGAMLAALKRMQEAGARKFNHAH